MGNEISFSLQTQTWERDSHGLFDYEFKKWQLNDLKLDESCQVIYREKDSVKLIPDYSKLKDIRDKYFKFNKEENLPEAVRFTVLGYLISDKEGHRISSINHYNTYFKHKDILKDKYEEYNYSEYGEHQQLDRIGVDRYCKDIWRVARDPKSMHCTKFKSKDKQPYQGELVQQGDIIKLGRIKFKLRKYWLNDKPQPVIKKKSTVLSPPEIPDKEMRPSQLINKNFRKEIFVEANEEIPPWRFCLSNEMDDDCNPLINPCQCKGTMGLLHIECMKHWLNTKKTVKEYNDGNCIIYTWKIVSCELCKQPYPHTIHFKDKSVCILEYDEPRNEPFIIFESYPKEGSRNETQKSIYICKLSKNSKNIKMGRAQQNELRIHDISISREHAEITIKDDGKLYIRDVKSKFGTLVLVKTPEIIPTNNDVFAVYQVGRTVFLFNKCPKTKGSFGSSLCKKFSGKKTKSRSPQKNRELLYNDDGEKEAKDAEMLLELEVEKLQKNNDSEFYLDDEFYERMANEFNQKQNPQILDHNEIRIEENGASKTEVEEDLRNDEEDDEGFNPLAQTSDGKNRDLARILSRIPTNTDMPARMRADTGPANEQEEEKRLSNSLSNENLEIRIDRNAPRFRGTADIQRPAIRTSLLKNSEESEDINPAAKSVREVERRSLRLNLKAPGKNDTPARRVSTPKNHSSSFM